MASQPSTPTTTTQPPTILNIPIELRLQIYSHILPEEPHQSRTRSFAYMYHSPGRVTRSGPAVKGPHMSLFWVCQRIRNEAIDEAFRNKTFVLEASIYDGEYGGLSTIPPSCFPTFWLGDVRKLVLFTVFDFSRARRMGDLWILQQMTGLRELWLNFKVLSRVRPAGYELRSDQNPVKALLDCVPKACVLRIGASEKEKETLGEGLGRTSLRYIFEDDTWLGARELLESEDGALKVTKGMFSGSVLDHSKCGLEAGVRCCDGQACVNTCLDKRKEKQSGTGPGGTGTSSWTHARGFQWWEFLPWFGR